MKSKYKYGIALALSVLVLMTTGCVEKKNKIDESKNIKQAYNRKMKKEDMVDGKINEDAVLVSVGDIEVRYSEVMVYVLLYKSDYEELLTKKIWSYKVENNKTFEQASKECVINQIVTSKVIEYGAKRMGVQIEPDEKIEIEDKAIECYNEVFKDLKGQYGITQGVVKEVLYDNYLAEKVYEVATNEVDVVVENSESRVPVVKQIEILFKGYDGDGNKITRSKQEAHERVVEVMNKIDADKDDYNEIALEYSDSNELEVKVTHQSNEKAYREAAKDLSEDECSEIIETSQGYYVLYCVSENDEELQEENIESIISDRQDTIFSKSYDNWLNENDIYVVSDLWNAINLSKL